jgi:cell division septation protein DedD
MRAFVFLVALMLAAPAAASVADGVDRWRQGDWAGAVAQWQAPAARGDPDALFNMGQAHRLGRGVAQDSRIAIDLYRQAAAKGHVGATTNLGITLWQEGQRTEALGHLRRAADQGDPRAAFVLGVATFSGDTAPRNPALGYAYVLRARDAGLEAASRQAARMATSMSPDARARGEAAAAALAAGRPVAVVMADLDAGDPRPASAGPAPGPPGSAPAEPDEDGVEVADSLPASARPRPGEARASASDSNGASPADAWKVQLGAYADEGAARTAWATLVSQSAGILKGRTPIYAPRGRLVRLQIGPFDARADASDLCTRLAAAGRPCFVTRS